MELLGISLVGFSVSGLWGHDGSACGDAVALCLVVGQSVLVLRCQDASGNGGGGVCVCVYCE